MSGERKNTSVRSLYGTLNMRPYVIFGNDIVAFYDKSDDLIFVLDNTVNSRKPNVLLVINPDGDKKWDEILSMDYMVDLEHIRPKQDNKYQKLDIEYSGLSVYENLINAYNAGEDLTDYLSQLDVLRDSAARHSAMVRLNAANEIIAKANNTIVKTKETISELQTKLKNLRAKLSAYRKEIGKVSTKQSAAKILKTESQIEATNENLKRAKKRLESAQRRLEAATNDAELASAVLNQPEPTINKQQHIAPKSESVIVAPKYEVQTTEPEEVDDDDVDEDEEEPEDNDIKPLFDTDPEILNEDIAFKPITFDAPTFPMEDTVPEETKEENSFEAPVFEPIAEEEKEEEKEIVPVLNADALLAVSEQNKQAEPIIESLEYTEQPADNVAQKSVLDSMMPVTQTEPDFSQEIVEEESKVVEPVEQDVRPVPPMISEVAETPIAQPITQTEDNKKSKFAYYVILILLIVLSVFTLWIYQKNMGDTKPVLTPKTSETVVKETEPTPAVEPESNALVDVVEESVFLDEPEPAAEPTIIEESVVVEQEPIVEEIVEPEPVVEPEVVESEPEFLEQEPTEVIEETPEADLQESVEEDVVEEPVEVEEIVVDKPEYDAGSKHEDMFIIENSGDDMEEAVPADDELFYDEEEAQYQAEFGEE